MIALNCPVLGEGAASPGFLPYLCPSNHAQAKDTADFAPALEWPWLPGKDEIKSIDSGLGSVVSLFPALNVPCSLYSSLHKH